MKYSDIHHLVGSGKLETIYALHTLSVVSKTLHCSIWFDISK